MISVGTLLIRKEIKKNKYLDTEKKVKKKKIKI